MLPVYLGDTIFFITYPKEEKRKKKKETVPKFCAPTENGSLRLQYFRFICELLEEHVKFSTSKGESHIPIHPVRRKAYCIHTNLMHKNSTHSTSTLEFLGSLGVNSLERRVVQVMQSHDLINIKNGKQVIVRV